jgi:CRISPR/Cas system-associated protein Cas10 (large subunit of type III CRISPR-Cas system)
MAPLAALGIVGDNAPLAQVAREADERLRRALSALEAASQT